MIIKPKFRKCKFVIISFLILMSISSYLYAESIGGSCSAGDGSCSTLKAEREARIKYLRQEALNKINRQTAIHTNYPLPPTTNKKNPIKKREQTIKQKKKVNTVPKGVKVANELVSTPVEIYPERTVKIYVSNSDINRIVCVDGDVGYIYSSSEKGVELYREKEEAYLKVKSIYNPQTGKVTKIKNPIEVFIKCNDKTYSFIAYPENIPAKTIYMVDLESKYKENQKITNVNRIDEAIARIVRWVFTDNIPLSWEKVRGFKPVKISKQVIAYYPADKEVEKKGQFATVKIQETERYKIPGTSIVVRVFTLAPKNKKYKLWISEKIFLDPDIVSNPLAISLEKHVVSRALPARAVVIEK